ncbi:hypothetical protein QQP08_017154 [Theobroma cacao]|nr:hypothetical protein QQP08_017154 [Theobroma cacao]
MTSRIFLLLDIESLSKTVTPYDEAYYDLRLLRNNFMEIKGDDHLGRVSMPFVKDPVKCSIEIDRQFQERQVNLS